MTTTLHAAAWAICETSGPRCEELCPGCLEQARAAGKVWLEAAGEITRLRAENEKLRDLLAIIHRDGGQHTAAVGVCQSVDDAHQRWADLLAEVDHLRDIIRFVERWVVYKRYKPDGKSLTAEEAIGIIAHCPPIREITKQYEGNGEIDQAAYEADLARMRAALAAQPAPKEVE